jgi:AraC-like DNA-binding protein
MVHLARKFSGAEVGPRAASFQHAPGGDIGGWLRCPVDYEQAWNAAVFDRATLELPFRHADPTQFAAIVAAASRALETVAPSTFLDAARAALRGLRGKRVSVPALAAALGVSERTLQRRLAEAGATFRQLADEVRVEWLAEHGGTGEKRAVTAGALGFADPSSVRRLRRRWKRATKSRG